MATTEVTPTDLAEIRSFGQQNVVSPATEAVTALVISDRSSYESADLILFKIRSARKTVATLIESRVDSIIKPIRAGLDKLYEARRQLLADLDQPLEQAEKQVKHKMSVYQAEERHKREEADRIKREEEDRLRRQQEEIERARLEAERKSEQARTAKARKEAAEREEKLREQQRELERQQEEARNKPTTVPPPIKVAGSRVTVVKHWRVKDFKRFAAAVAAGDIPDVALQPDTQAIESLWKADPQMVSAWPGIEVYEETRISGR